MEAEAIRELNTIGLSIMLALILPSATMLAAAVWSYIVDKGR